MSNKLMAAILSVIMTVSVLPQMVFAAAGEEQEPYYIEDFENQALLDEITGRRNGWNWDEEETGKTNINIDTFSERKALRFASTDWYKSSWLSLSFLESGIQKQMESGVGQEQAQNNMEEALRANTKLSFMLKFENDGADSGQTHEAYMQIKGAEDQVISELRMKNNILYLSVLNQEQDRNELYPILEIGDVKQGTNWLDVSYYLDMATDCYAISIDGVFIETPVHGKWIPASNSGADGEEAQHTEIGMVKGIEMGHFWSGWWQKVLVDDIALRGYAPLGDEPSVPSETPPPVVIPDSVFYIEDFAGGDALAQEIRQNKNGWETRVRGEQGDETGDAEILDVYISQDGGGKGNTLRFSSMQFFKNALLSLDFKENAVYKRMQDGAPEEQAEGEILEALSDNVKLSIRIKFETEDADENESHIHMIQVKDIDGAVAAELRLEKGLLYWNGYLIDSNVDCSKNNNQWHDFVFYFNRYTQKVSLEHNGTVFESPDFGPWVPVDFSMLREIVFEHDRSGWWQKFWIDSISLENFQGEDDGTYAVRKALEKLKIDTEPKTNTMVLPDQDEELGVAFSWESSNQAVIDPAGNIIRPKRGTIYVDLKVTAVGSTGMAAEKVFKIAVLGEEELAAWQNSQVLYEEHFEDAVIEQEIRQNQNGWSHTFGQDSGDAFSVWIGDGTNDKKALRFAAMGYFKNMEIALDFYENAVKKEVEQGKSEDQARREAQEYLSDDIQVSFKVNFETEGIDSGGGHCQTICIKKADGVIISQLKRIDKKLYIVALDQDKKENRLYLLNDNISIIKGNHIWHEFVFGYSQEKNAYTLKMDGVEFKGTPHGRWIPVSNASEVGPAEEILIDRLGAISFGHQNSGWWQKFWIDDIVLKSYTPVYTEEEEIADVNAALDELEIDTAPSGDTLYLPGKSGKYEVVFHWKSHDSSIITDSGDIKRPQRSQYVAITVTSEGKNGYTKSKTYRIYIAGTSNQHAGTVGASNSSGSGTNPKPIAPVVTPAPEDGQTAQTGQKDYLYFEDVSQSDWFAPYINQLAEDGVVDKSARYFRPGDGVTRAEFIKMIVESLAIKDETARVDFEDVTEDSWSYPYIASAAKFGIVNGMGDRYFGAGEQITREDMAVIIYRAVKMAGAIERETDTAPFDDWDEISDYARESVACLYDYQVVNGDNGKFRPASNATRAEAAKMVCMMVDICYRA